MNRDHTYHGDTAGNIGRCLHDGERGIIADHGSADNDVIDAHLQLLKLDDRGLRAGFQTSERDLGLPRCLVHASFARLTATVDLSVVLPALKLACRHT